MRSSRFTAAAATAITFSVVACGAANEVGDEAWVQSCGGVPEPTFHTAPVLACELEQPRLRDPPEAPDDESLARARQSMEYAVALLGAPEGARFEAALPELERAYTLSGSPKVLDAYATAAEQRGRTTLALDALERLVVPADPATAARAEALRRRIAWVELRTNAPGLRVTDILVRDGGSLTGNVYLVDSCGARLALEPGHHKLELDASHAWPGAAPQTWELDVASGVDQTHKVLFGSTQPRPQ